MPVSTSGMSPIRRRKILCTGILVADIFVPPMQNMPSAGELLATADFLLESGGCAANVSVGLKRLEVDAEIGVQGVVGSDVFGRFLIEKLQANEIETSHIRSTTDYGTSKTVILPVIDQDRRFIHTFGANNAFQESDIDLTGLLAGDVLYIGGLLILPSFSSEGAARICEEARSRGIITVLDVVVPAIAADPQTLMAFLAPILPHTDVFMPNDDEARVLTGEGDIERQADTFLSAGAGTAVITCGAHRTLVKAGSESLLASTYAIDFVDGSGSGDAFAAGYITGLVEGWDLEKTLRFASAAGASACTQLGCTRGVFSRTEAEEFIRVNSLHISSRKG